MEKTPKGFRLHIGLFGRREPEVHEAVVVIDHLAERREPTVVIEAALRVGPQPVQRRSPVRMIGRTIRLEVIYADL